MPISEQDLHEMYSIQEAADDVFHVSRSTVNRMIANGELEIVRVGSGRGRVRITKRAILDNLNGRVTKATSKGA